MKRRGHGKYGVASKIDRTSRDGTVFDSKGELQRYEKLRLHLLTKDIRLLRRQVKFPLIVNGVAVGHYTADFVYDRLVDGQWIEVVEDFKGVMTKDAAFRIKVFEACYGRAVQIVRK